MTTWAPLTKSPNCASQITRQSGLVVAYPYSNPTTASSDRTESMTVKRRLPFAHVLQRRVAATGVLIVQHRLAMEEGAARTVLPGKPHGVPSSSSVA